jgi:hypothetical protein
MFDTTMEFTIRVLTKHIDNGSRIGVGYIKHWEIVDSFLVLASSLAIDTWGAVVIFILAGGVAVLAVYFFLARHIVRPSMIDFTTGGFLFLTGVKTHTLE